MLAPHGESLPGPFWTAKAFEALDRYPSWIRDLEAESGKRIDYLLCGSVEYGPNGQRECPNEAIVDPREIMAALRQGQNIREGVEVTEIDQQSARSIVISAGAWSGGISGMPPSLPVRGHLIAYDMPPGSLGPFRRRASTYILQRSSGLTVVGSTEEQVGFDRTLDREALTDLERRGAALWPELEGLRPVEAWCGFRPATPSGMPEVGRIPGTNIWRAYGHFRNGILLAPVTGELVAREIIESLRSGS